MTFSDEMIEKEIISVLRETEHPAEPQEVFSKLREKHDDIDNGSIRNAVWRLIVGQKVELTPKLELRLLSNGNSSRF
jgi:repressor of nif and glnA expression